MPSPSRAYRLAEHVPEVLAFVRREYPDVSADQLQPILSMFDENMRAWRSERAMEALEDRRRRGLRSTRHAGLGWRFSGRRGHQRRVPDDAERRVMAKVVEWWEAGYSWFEIARHLLLNKVKTADGREWSPSRVRRAFLAAIRPCHSAWSERRGSYGDTP
jgi:hypothetical protein